MTTVRVRYMINELDPAVEFYTKYLGFQLKQQNKLILRCFPAVTWNWCSAPLLDQVGQRSRCPTGASLSQGDGTASSLT